MRRVDEERRRTIRYRFGVPVHLQNGCTGRARDMSTSGVFFETEQAYTCGETIRLTIVLNDSTVQCEGRVVRVERLEDRFGIAIDLASYSFS